VLFEYLACEGHLFRDNIETCGIFESDSKHLCVFSSFSYCSMQDGRPILLSLILYSIKVDTPSHLEVQISFRYSAGAYLTAPGALILMNMKTSQQV
jgi:hypothetical protein